MDTKIRVWVVLLLATLAIAAVTGVPHLQQPDLVEPMIALIVFLIVNAFNGHG